MLCKKVLLAYDGSDHANRAVQKVAELAELLPELEVHIMFVTYVPVVTGGNMYYVVPDVERDAIREQGRAMAAEAEKALLERGVRVQTFVEEGSPGETILEHAAKHNCDLIAIGSRGLSGIKEFFLGSVSHYVTQHAAVPVFIVK